MKVALERGLNVEIFSYSASCRRSRVGSSRSAAVSGSSPSRCAASSAVAGAVVGDDPIDVADGSVLRRTPGIDA